MEPGTVLTPPYVKTQGLFQKFTQNSVSRVFTGTQSHTACMDCFISNPSRGEIDPFHLQAELIPLPPPKAPIVNHIIKPPCKQRHSYQAWSFKNLAIAAQYRQGQRPGYPLGKVNSSLRVFLIKTPEVGGSGAGSACQYGLKDPGSHVILHHLHCVDLFVFSFLSPRC